MSKLLIILLLDDFSQLKPAMMRIEADLQYSAAIAYTLVDAMMEKVPIILENSECQWVLFMHPDENLTDKFRERVYPLLATAAKPDGMATSALRYLPVTNNGPRHAETMFQTLLTFGTPACAFSEWISDRLCALEVWKWAQRQRIPRLFPGREIEAMSLLLGLSVCMRVGFILGVNSPFLYTSTFYTDSEFADSVRWLFVNIWLGFIVI